MESAVYLPTSVQDEPALEKPVDLSDAVEVAPVPPIPRVAPDIVPVEDNTRSRHFRTLLNKYSLTVGLHTICRSQVELGKNTCVVTQEGTMKVVNSIKVHGFLEDVNYLDMVFNLLDPQFKDRNAIKNSPTLLEEIVTMGRFIYDAGAHCELPSHHELWPGSPLNLTQKSFEGYQNSGCFHL